MDCYNNYIDYRNGPSPYMHPYHHTSLHPAALRYAPSHQHHHFSRNAYGNSYPNYYDTSYRYYHQYSSNAYNHPAIPPTPPPSHYQNYASLREGFSGSSSSNNTHSNSSGNIVDSDHYPNSGYYGQSSPFTSTTAATPGINPYENYRQSNYHHPMAYHRSSNSYYSDTFYDTYETPHAHHPSNALSGSTTATNPSTPSGTPKSAYTDEYPSSPAMIRSESRCDKDVESGKSETSCKNEAPGTPGESMETTTTPIVTPIDISQSNMPPSSPMTPNSTEMSNSTSESFCNSKGNRSVRRSNQRERTLMSRKNNTNSMINDPYEFTEDHNNSTSPHTESRVPNNECSSQAWMHQGVQNTHKWMRGHHNKKGLPMSDLELLQSSFEYGFYNNNYQHPNNNETYRMSRKVNDKHFITDGPNDIVPVKRTKRRRKENNTSEMFNNRKVEEKIERKPPEPPLTPLPGFQEAFGSTEIGRFSDAFFNVLNSSPYYEPNNESDIDTLSPQPWEAGDSLEGPHFNLQVGASFTPVYDNYSADGSPLDNYFSELSCNEF